LESRGFARSRPLWLGPVCVGALALALGFLYLAQIRHNPFFYHPIVDAADYDRDAWYMAQSGDWSGGRAVYFQAPLFTQFLAMIYSVAGHNLLWPRIIQVLLGAITAVGAFLIARRLFGERAAWIAGLAAACYSMLIFYEGELLAPTLTVFLDVAMFLALFAVALKRPGWVWAVPGFLFGFRALATTNNLAVLPVVWIWTWFYGRSVHWPRKQAVLAIAAFTVGVVVAIAPVTVRNWAVGRQFVLVSSNAGLNFYLGNSGDYQAKVGLRPGADWDELMNAPLRAGVKTERAMSDFYFREAGTYIRQHPAAYLRLLGFKCYVFLRGDEILRNQEIYAFRSYSAVLRLLLWKFGGSGSHAGSVGEGGSGSFGIAFPFGVLLPLAWPGFVLLFQRRDLRAGLLAAFSLVYSISVIAFFVTARYRMPVVIPLAVLMASGMVGWRTWWGAPRARVIAIAGIVALALISNWNPGPMAKEMNPDAYVSLGRAYAEQGDPAGAERYYEKALSVNPRDVGALVNLGLDVYEKQGLLDKAEECYRQALVIRPGYGIAVFDLGHLAELRGQTARAESLYLEAARLDPLMPGPYRNLGGMALARGEYARAQQLYAEARARDPLNTDILVGLGVATFKTEGLAAGLRLFDQALKNAPTNSDAYYNLAMVYAQAGQPSKAADAALKLVELSPEDNQAYLILAETMRAAGRSEEARLILEDAARRYPNLPGPREGLTRLRR